MVPIGQHDIAIIRVSAPVVLNCLVCPVALYALHSLRLYLLQALRKSLIDQKRILNVVPEAPVFHPSVEEFKDVLKYIVSIKKAGEAAGIVKIVPPPGVILIIDRASSCRNVLLLWQQS